MSDIEDLRPLTFTAGQLRQMLVAAVMTPKPPHERIADRHVQMMVQGMVRQQNPKRWDEKPAAYVFCEFLRHHFRRLPGPK